MNERWKLWCSGAALVAARCFLVFRYRFDSDEPQHMHVAWGWAHGLVQYRDFFDNHMPLFHLLSAPLFALGGDDVRLLFAARLLMLPLFAASLALVWFIARALFDDDTAILAVVLAAITPPFFLGTLEYRTDDLWVVFWLAALASCVSGLPPQRRSVLAGLAFGLAFAVSMKTVLLVLAIAGAAITTVLLTTRRGAPRDPHAWTRWLAAFVAVASAVPALIFGGFALAGAWPALRYGVFSHNSIPYEHAYRVLWIVPLYPVVRAIALAIAKSEGDDDRVRRRLFIFLAAAFYVSLLVSFWPMTSMQSFLPFYPLAAICAAPLLRPRPLLAAATCVLAMVATLVMARPWHDDTRDQVAVIEDVLALTTPDEPVMDLKGETVFRVRPWYHGIEAITNIKLRLGWIRDDIAQTLIRSRTYVVASYALTYSFPPDALRFIERNYVPWGTVRVAGSQVRSPRRTTFCIAIPGRYVVVTPDGKVVPAAIDRREVERGIELAAGEHQLETREALDEVIVVWSGVLRARRGPSRERGAITPSGSV